jgi:hypothetical protein
MQEGTTLRVMEADRPYGEFHDFYSISLKYFVYTLVFQASMSASVSEWHITWVSVGKR